MTRTTVMRMFAALLVVALIAAACGGSDESSVAQGNDGDFTSATTAAAAAEGSTGGDVDAPAEESGGEALGDGGVEPTVLPSASQTNRDIIFTANVTVAVSDVAGAGAQATQAIESLGGFLFGQETRGEPEPRSVLTFKIAPENFQEALARLGEIGEVRTQSVTADDVTERVVDLQSRITTAEASVERLRGFLEQATDITSIAEIEAQLLDRETELETLRGQLRTIQGLVNLATIFLTLTEAESQPQLDVMVSGYRDIDDGAACPGDFGVSVDEGDPVTLCFELINTGDTNLQDFELKDAVLGIDSVDDLTLVFGNPDEILEPGQSIIWAFGFEPERRIRTQTRTTASPVLEDGTILTGRSVSETSSIEVDARDPGGIPGFFEGLTAGWEFVVTVVSVLILAAGTLLPLLIILIPLGWVLFAFTRRRRAKAAERAAVVSEHAAARHRAEAEARARVAADAAAGEPTVST